jgi:arylsulfatase A-like enzyme
MMALGTAVDKPQIIERPVLHVDLGPTLASLLGCPPMGSQGAPLRELKV